MIITTNNFSLLNVPSVSLTSSMIVAGLITKPTRIHVKIAMIGIITLFVTKSNASRIAIPSGWMWLHTPFPSDEGIPTTKVKSVTATQAGVLSIPVLSLTIETTVSISEIEDVSAAKNTNTKNTYPRRPPIGILLNTFGNVMNIRPAPALRSSGPE